VERETEGGVRQQDAAVLGRDHRGGANEARLQGAPFLGTDDEEEAAAAVPFVDQAALAPEDVPGVGSADAELQ
jgi:hypothetical protein